MLPLKDNIPTRTFPIVTVAIIVANALVWLLYEHAGSGHAFQSAVWDQSENKMHSVKALMALVMR